MKCTAKLLFKVEVVANEGLIILHYSLKILHKII